MSLNPSAPQFPQPESGAHRAAGRICSGAVYTGIVASPWTALSQTSDMGKEGHVTGPSLRLEQERLDRSWVAVVGNLPENSSQFTVGEVSARVGEKNTP